MYTIGAVPEGVILICTTCNHIERVSQFSLSLGSQRTQTAQAMQAHSRHEHHPAPLPELLPNKYEVLASAGVSGHMWSFDK
jgi:hypothetical protein